MPDPFADVEEKQQAHSRLPSQNSAMPISRGARQICAATCQAMPRPISPRGSPKNEAGTILALNRLELMDTPVCFDYSCERSVCGLPGAELLDCRSHYPPNQSVEAVPTLARILLRLASEEGVDAGALPGLDDGLDRPREGGDRFAELVGRFGPPQGSAPGRTFAGRGQHMRRSLGGVCQGFGRALGPTSQDGEDVDG
jgi:hypothetical protein